MNVLEKIQSLPERKRKIILWLIMVIVGGILVFFYIKNVQRKLESFREKELKMIWPEILKNKILK